MKEVNAEGKRIYRNWKSKVVKNSETIVNKKYLRLLVELEVAAEDFIEKAGSRSLRELEVVVERLRKFKGEDS